uniref:Histone-lysine N-methyltransferase 2B n=1 Tax=Ananas comosus var. bracteatus TaxID=296719 RepID=A0A6V7NJ85_ANACO|nr:unnamed protein product [Ananas comosus var. bracteatus]
MAFHVACPITCRRICDCELGFPGAVRSARERIGFLEEISLVEEFLRDPWILRKPAGPATVQVAVPKVVPPPPSLQADDGGGGGTGVGSDGDGGGSGGAGGGGGGGEESAWAASVRARRAELQRQAAAASVAAEDYVRRLEAGGAPAEVSGEELNNLGTEDQAFSTVKVICRICFSGENEGSNRALKMLPCRLCSKKYHRSCLKVWAEYRDLFHWSSWSCPSCRICEVCRRTGDPTKFKFCKRCDAAYHCYCQQPPHKNVSHGPYLCPKHTRCHSCGSTVPGSGLSTSIGVMWFLSYTCCDACGRLFVKGKYCPVCLKVYRDSEMTPMVCCDTCQQWVHCMCDGISDEKYRQFEADRHLKYKCPVCRGDCYKVKDIDDAVQELWRRRDRADRALIGSLRAAAGLPMQEEIFSICPYSDDEESGPLIVKNKKEKSLKFSVKGFIDNLSKKCKEDRSPLSKKSSKNIIKKVSEKSQTGASFIFYGDDGGKSIGDQPQSINNHGFKEVIDKKSAKVLKGSKVSAGKNSSKCETTKGTKLVIHIGTKSKNASSSPKSENSSCHRDLEFTSFDDKEDVTKKTSKILENQEKIADVARSKHPSSFRSHLTRETSTRADSTMQNRGETTLRSGEGLPINQSMGTASTVKREINEAADSSSGFKPSKDTRPLLKLKFKNPYIEQQSSWASGVVEEKNPIKGPRSKRKRPFIEKVSTPVDENYEQLNSDESMNEDIDALWILKKLGKDAIGKRIEVHKVSGNSW